jgi:hypothetical protein
VSRRAARHRHAHRERDADHAQHFDVHRLWLRFSRPHWIIETMKVATPKKGKDEAALLDQATDQLLRAVKARMLKKDGRVDYARLRKEGYSDRFLARLEAV